VKEALFSDMIFRNFPPMDKGVIRLSPQEARQRFQTLKLLDALKREASGPAASRLEW
jgi:hypothetical protein